jgi:hypothetical protein
MPTSTTRHRVSQRAKQSLLGAALAVGLAFAAPKPAQALTVVLDFVSGATTDAFGVGTLHETFSAWGFTGLDSAGVRLAVLNAVYDDYLNFPSRPCKIQFRPTDVNRAA